MKKYIYLIVLYTIALPNIAQQKWHGKFGWWGVDIGYDVVETLDGHYMVTGYTGSFTNGNSDVLVTKVHQQGWPMWTVHIGSINNDIGKAIIRTADSGFVIAGYTNSYGNGGYDGYLIKINKAGNLLWQKTFGGIDWDFFQSLQQTSDMGYVIVGYSYNYSKGGKDMWIVKTDSIGNLQWEKKLGGIQDDEFVSVEITLNNQIACFGTTYSFSDTKGNYCIYKTNNNGDSLFFKDFGYPNLSDIGYDFFERPTDSAFVICGTSQSPLGTDSTYYHQLVVNSNCNWIADIKETTGELKNQIAYTNTYFNANKHYVVYDRYGNGSGKHEPNFYTFTSQYFINGTSYGSTEDDIIYSCKRTSDKGLIAVGYTTGFNALQEDVFIVKLDSLISGANSVVHVNTISSSLQLKTYPNTATNYIYIQTEQYLSTLKIIIQDIQGRVVLSEQINEPSHNNKINISHLEDGLYIVRVLAENKEEYNTKFIKSSRY